LIITILAFIFVLGIVVFFHELGHFLVAKASGVRVYKFSLGFPPKMVGFKKGDTEYCISWIPLGGYVKMAGENPLEGEELGKDDPGNLLNKPSWIKALIFAAGPFANYITAILIATALFYFLGKEVVDPDKFVVGMVEPNSPAAKVDLKPGDVILSIGGNQVTQISDIQELVYDHPDTKYNIEWESNGHRHSALIETASDTATNMQDKVITYGKIGVAQATDTLPVGVGEAFVLANKASWRVTVLMADFIKKLVTRQASTKLLGGPIAIAKISGQKAREGFFNLMDLVVLLSINLAILNLLPIPVLDGGHLFLLGIEVVRRRPLTLKQKAVFQQVGLVILILIIVMATYNDILRNITG
jgi:regulator of sigma E protease